VIDSKVKGQKGQKSKVKSQKRETEMLRKTIMLMVVTVAAAVSVAAAVQNTPPSSGQTRSPPDAAVGKSGLSDLEPFIRSCPRVALNAAARRAASVPTQGKYQFSHFSIVSDSHHALYEVHFTSNYEDESVLKYCVEVYCQQGWDPKDVRTSITLMSNAPQRAATDAHGSGCAAAHMPATRRQGR
jgi:hypothetical protein